jgi:predicted NUDIX family NTP pyrophosphohydrolase
MSLSKKINLIIYRFRERGLEIFLVNDPENAENWSIPEGQMNEAGTPSRIQQDKFIELDPVQQDDGKTQEAFAVEGEWHDIPSLKSMLMEDAVHLTEKIKEVDKGTYFAVKEAFKRVLPHQYKFLKELKDILIDRNSVQDL